MDKIGLIGTSCSGKTTAAHEVLYRLKSAGVRADALLQQDRRFTFGRAALETSEAAQHWMIFNLMAKEAEVEASGEVDVLVCDQTPLTMYAFLEHQYGEDSELRSLVIKWMRRYTLLLYLPPLPYEDDGTRPTDQFRTAVHGTLRRVLNESLLPVMEVKKEALAHTVLTAIGRTLSPQELSLIPRVLKADVLIGGSYSVDRQKRWSDVDVYARSDGQLITAQEVKGYERTLTRILGVPIELSFVDDVMWAQLQDVAGFKEFKYT